MRAVTDRPARLDRAEVPGARGVPGRLGAAGVARRPGQLAPVGRRWRPKRAKSRNGDFFGAYRVLF